MKLKKITPQILHFKCKNRKELTLTFCRVQEFYEAQNNKLRGKSFDLFTFIDTFMDQGGNIDYFSQWSGFNFTSTAFYRWRELNPDPTPYEDAFAAKIEREFPLGGKFYVIATLAKDTETLDHEIAHALYFLNDEYRETALFLVRSLPKRLVKLLHKTLEELGYDEGVMDDEINAYLSTSSKKYLKKRFDDAYNHLVPLDDFRAAFAKHSAVFDWRFFASP